MQLTADDYQELQAHGPTGLTTDQYFRLLKAVERIKGAAFQDGRLAEREWQRARNELANAKADITHAPTDSEAKLAAVRDDIQVEWENIDLETQGKPNAYREGVRDGLRCALALLDGEATS